MIAWNALEHPYREKSADWFWAVGIITVSLAVSAIIYNNLLLASLIIIGAIALVLQAIKKPRNIHFEINKKGIGVGNTFHPYLTLESFWVEEQTEEPKILLKSKKILLSYIIIPLGGEDPEVIREYLSQYLEEVEHAEPFSQKIMEYLGF